MLLTEMLAAIADSEPLRALVEAMTGDAASTADAEACVVCPPDDPWREVTLVGGTTGPVSTSGDDGPAPPPDDPTDPPDEFDPPEDWPPKPKTDDELFDDVLDKATRDDPLTPEERFEADQYSDEWDTSGDTGETGPSGDPQPVTGPDAPDELDLTLTVTQDLATEVALEGADSLAKTGGLATGTLGTLGTIASGSETAAKGYMAVQSSKGRGYGGGSKAAQDAMEAAGMAGDSGGDSGGSSSGSSGSGD